MTNPFSSPAAPGAPEPAPRPRDLVGCLVAYSPRAFTPAGAPGNDKGVGNSEPRNRVTADLIVLDTPRGPIAFGGSPEWEQDPKPHYLAVAGPAKFDGVWISNQTIVNALAPNGQPLLGQLVLGVIERSTFGQKPFNLVAVDGTPAMEKAIDIYNRLSMGAAQYNTPQPIPGAPVPQGRNAPTGAPMPPANSVSYGYAPSPVPQAPTAWMGQQPPAPVMPPVPQAPPVAPTAPAAPAQPSALTSLAAPDMAAFAAWQAQQALAAQFPGSTGVPIPPATPPVNGLEPVLLQQGWTPESWATLNDNEKSQVRVSVGLPPF